MTASLTQHSETDRTARELSLKHADLWVRVYRWGDRSGYSDRHFIRFEAVPATEIDGRQVKQIASYRNGVKLLYQQETTHGRTP